MVRETGVQSQIESYQRLKKWFLMAPCSTQHYKLQIKSRWSNPQKGIGSSHTPLSPSTMVGSLNLCCFFYCKNF